MAAACRATVRPLLEQPVILFGRDGAVARLARSQAPMTLLSGDSGIGKSEVLAAAQRQTIGAIAPPPHTLPSSGVLQRVLLDGLGDVLAAQVATQGRVEETARSVLESVEGIVRERGAELVRVIGLEMLAVVRAKLGTDVGAATAEFISSLRANADQRLAVRLDTAVDRDAVQLVLALASEVIARLDPPAAVLALDAGERLPEAGMRVLADLAGAMPNGLRLRVAMATYTRRQRAMVEMLRALAPAVAEIPLEGLPEEAVANWLEHAGLATSLAPRAARASGGYPLHLTDLVRHLGDGGAIDDAPLHEVFARRTEEAWAQLDVEVARHARKLCVLVDPLPPSRATQLLGIDAAAWGEVQDRLREAGIFSGHVNGLPWFHEQRQRYLSEKRLEPHERGEASASAVRVLAEIVLESDRAGRVAELAELAAHATPLLEGSVHLCAAVALDREQLALCASLVELIDPGMAAPAVAGDDLLRHARTVFGAKADLVASFRSLRDSPLVHVDERQDVAVAVPTWSEALDMLVVAGRAARELGRGPVSAAASAVFRSEIEPRIRPFETAGYGIGHAPMARLGEVAVEQRAGSGAWVDNRAAGPNLLLRGEYAGRPIYASVCFANEAARDEALGRLQGHRSEVFEQRFDVTDVLAHPLAPVPARRFLLAAQRLLGGDLRVDARGLKGQRPLPFQVDAQEGLHRRLAVLAALRERCESVERYALRLDQPTGFFFYAQEGILEVAEILGAPGFVRRSQQPLGIMTHDPFRVFRIEQLAQLGEGERVGRMSASASRVPVLKDPAVEALNDVVSSATEFNAIQRRLELRLDDTELQPRLEDALNRRREDAWALRESGAFGDDLPEPSPLAYDVELVHVTDERLTFLGAAAWMGSVIVRKHDGGCDLVTVRVSEGPSRSLPDLDRLEGDSWSHGGAETILAELLGHRDDDLRFTD